MSRLLGIQNTAQQIAEAITAALGVETEIVDDELNIVAGTGRYKQKIGQKEEEGNIESGYTYAQVLKTGKEYIVEDAQSDPYYDPRENEMAEVCCPIWLGNSVIGLMGLVAFNERQKEALLCSKGSLLIFLKRMGLLLASKVSETEISNELKTIIESIRDGIIAVDKNGIITSCNFMAEKLTGRPRDELIGKALKELWPGSPVLDVIKTGIEYRDREEIYPGPFGENLHFFTTACPIFGGEGNDGSGAHREIIGAVISFRDIADVRRMVYNITEKKESSSFDEIFGVSRQIRELKSKAEKIAKSDSTVLITGESGTGKGLFARAIHFSSRRNKGPFIIVNCGAIPDTLLESELFGYEHGAFTGAKKTGKAGKFELANGGTIFLDEIGDLPLHLQAKLLHVLQRREIERVGGTRVIPVDVRVIAATNRNLEQMMQEGEFREDLYFRLNVIPLYIPPLRERKEDIHLLLEHSLSRYNRLIGKKIQWFESDALRLLLDYEWPGNVRELENTVEYAVNMETGSLIAMESLPPRLRRGKKAVESFFTLREQVDAFEKEIIERCLQETGFSVEGKIKAAKLLGISESTLYRRIRELKIGKNKTGRGGK